MSALTITNMKLSKPQKLITLECQKQLYKQYQTEQVLVRPQTIPDKCRPIDDHVRPAKTNIFQNAAQVAVSQLERPSRLWARSDAC